MYTCFDSKVGRYGIQILDEETEGSFETFDENQQLFSFFCFKNKLNYENFELHRVLIGSYMTN